MIRDPTNFVENAYTAYRALEIMNQGAKNLAKLSNLTAVLEVAALTQQLYQDVNGIVGGLIGRGEAWGGLMGSVPTTPAELFAWNQQASSLAALCGTEALAAQRVLRQATQMLGHLTQLLGTVQGLVGNLQGLQALITQTSGAYIALTRLEAVTAGFQLAMAGDILIRHMNERASVLIAQKSMRCWGQLCD